MENTKFKEMENQLRYLQDEMKIAIELKSLNHQTRVYKKYVKICEESGYLQMIDDLEKELRLKRNYFTNSFPFQSAFANDKSYFNPLEILEKKKIKPEKMDKKDLINIINRIYNQN